MVKKRSVAVCILLNIVTFGIYGIYLNYCIGKETNIICEDDGINQMNYICAFLLGLVTFGMYPMFWDAAVMNRLRIKAHKMNLNAKMYSDTSYVLWSLLGSLILVGPFIATHHFITQINAFADVREDSLYSGESNVPPLMGRESIPAPVVDNGNIGFNDVDEVPPTTPLDQTGAYASGIVTCESGSLQGAVFELGDGDEIIIGTNPNLCNIVVEDTAGIVSERHCAVSYNARSNNYTVIDFSSNGTFLGTGEQLINNAPKVIPYGELIIIGDAQNAFRVG
ncbi:MAG: DUF4234 domain-containing protein [Ruminococcus sp.]|nr:DUF4234 domain-containing protein [Ruminococcus sp.]